MQFDVLRVLKLDFLGKGWEECELIFKSITVRQAQKFSGVKEEDALTQGMNLLKQNFVKGDGISDGEKVALKKDHIDDLPLAVINRAITLLVEDITVDKKK